MAQAPVHPASGDVYHDTAAGPLVDALTQGVLLTRDGCVVWANRFLCGLAGRGDAAGALAGLKLDELFEDSGRGLPRDEGPGRVDCFLLRPDSERREVLCHRIDVREPDRAGSAVWVIEDVTHLRRLERELHRMGHELASANRECERLREDLRVERRDREELLSVVSHELRTPVTVIRGYSNLLLTEEVGPLTEEQRRFLGESRKGCDRLNRFIGNLIEASRADKGASVLELGLGPVAPVLEGVVSMFRPLLEERGMTAEVEARGSARFDRARLEQILTNLVANAIKYGERGGHVELRAGPASDARFLEIVVSDDGPGVPASERERIFEPYAQVGERTGGGLGLGLAICRRLVEAHGGEIHASERPGGGARFHFTLPREAGGAEPSA